MHLEDVVPSEIHFQNKLHSSEFSHVFLVVVRNCTCVMKVHHGRGPRKYYEPDRELDIHVLECLVPDYFGSMRKFDPRLCQPHLNPFVDDEYLPSAIFLEYIPGIEMMTINNCTEPRFNSMIMGIKEIHKALVRHRDPKPRNIMVLNDQPERVVWIDFDRAETYDEDTITERQIRFLDEEEQTVGELAECLRADVQKGKLDEAYLFYCT
ncbi:hypothetical protein ATEIFO6365_0001039500 [Aspergillus terreus]|uniref:Uncharacterized protein n=1 Tax=Aspergillus terreus TaxID=33178 RepID=A0A5M3YMG1_ASPTE|nr:hypothetical protein ATETN484_0001031600 [Aspergillus terreus]GFF12172.1 hypothetical protein ATEIFO6365_0001039500 [Aspergillus terreus]